jgi:2-oxo-hept-3-ene-1,7-dioate hydratase
MLDIATQKALAHELEIAERTRVPCRHFSARYPEMTIDDSYAIAGAWMAIKRSHGASVIGRKVGLTSRAMQRAAAIDEPDFGTLLDTMLVPNCSVVVASHYLAPRIEAEFAFRLHSDLAGPNVSPSDVLAATLEIIPALEIIDARIERIDARSKRLRTVRDTIADNGASAGLILGERSAAPQDLDWRWAGAILAKNGSVEETGLGAGVLDHPVHGVVWLVRKLAAYGEVLRANELVLSGSFIRPVECNAGDLFRADFGPLGVVEVAFQ